MHQSYTILHMPMWNTPPPLFLVCFQGKEPNPRPNATHHRPMSFYQQELQAQLILKRVSLDSGMQMNVKTFQICWACGLQYSVAHTFLRAFPTTLCQLRKYDPQYAMHTYITSGRVI